MKVLDAMLQNIRIRGLGLYVCTSVIKSDLFACNGNFILLTTSHAHHVTLPEFCSFIKTIIMIAQHADGIHFDLRQSKID